MYHRFGYEENNTLFVSPENFMRQMAYLKKRGYRVISLEELVKGLKKGKRFKHKTVVITIDDGYKDNYIYAYPVLRKYHFPATIFLIADFIGKKEEFMNWKQVNTLVHSNIISIGGHTRVHSYLPEIKEKERLWEEISGCKRVIEERINRKINYFCYPTGGFNEQIKAMVRRAGYKGACTTNRGEGRDVYELRRIKITNSDMNKPFNFWAKLSGYYYLFRRKKASE